jgi:ZIP family zinc transporter
MLNLIALGAVAGMIPVYLGILSALFLGKVLPRTWEGGLIGVANGVLVYLFFDLMHEATEQTGARDPVSWLVFLGSLGISFVGLVALESSQIFGARAGSRWLSLPTMIAVGDGLAQSRRGTGDRRQLRQRGIYAEPPAGGRVRLA